MTIQEAIQKRTELSDTLVKAIVQSVDLAGYHAAAGDTKEHQYYLGLTRDFGNIHHSLPHIGGLTMRNAQ